jgi:hypothetical protein
MLGMENVSRRYTFHIQATKASRKKALVTY